MTRPKTSRSHRKTLRVQADVPHTFWPLLVPLAAILAFWGIYLIERAVSHPLESDVTSILFGSFSLACGLLLFSFLLRSVHIPSVSHSHHAQEHAKLNIARLGRRRILVAPKTQPPPRPFHRFYVDETRISR